MREDKSWVDGCNGGVTKKLSSKKVTLIATSYSCCSRRQIQHPFYLVEYLTNTTLRVHDLLDKFW